MKWKSIFIYSVGVLLLAVLTYLFLNFNNFLVKTTEKIATDALGVEVNIGSIDVNLSDKSVFVKGITVRNPSGYSRGYITTTDQVEIVLNTASAELINFKDIKVTGSVVNVEVNENGMNLVDLKNLANKKSNNSPSTDEAIKVVIKRMVMGASTINTRVTFLEKDLATIKMPSISFSNIGQGKGIEADDAIVQIMTKYLTSIEKHVRVKGLLSGVSVPGIEDVQKTIEGAVDSLKKLF